MSVRIREATPGDARAIAAVHRASRDAAYRGLVDEALLRDMSPAERQRRWVGWLADPAVTTLVAENRGQVVGFVTVCATRDDDLEAEGAAEMPTLYVHPGWWRRGVGRRLCQAGCRWAREEGFPLLTLWVLELNRAARTFYEALGFEADGATKWDDGPTPAPFLAHRYRLELPGEGRGDTERRTAS